MAKSSKEYKKKETGPLSLSELNMWLDFADQAAKAKHWDYFVIDQFLKGNHSIRGNPQDNTLVLNTAKTDPINFPINKVYSTFRAVKNFVVRHKPVATIEVSQTTEEAKNYARRAERLLDRDNALNNYRRINREWVYYGVKYGLGWRKIGYDPIKKVTQKWSVDPFDVLSGSRTGEPEDAPYLIHNIVRTVAYWRNKYPNCNVQPDNELAADEYKRLSLQIMSPDGVASKQRLEEQTAIGHECWYRVFKPNKNGGLVNKCLFTKTEILAHEETPFTEYPFIPYEVELTPNESPDGHLKHVIAPQRMLNLLNTQLLEYNHIVNRGRMVIDQNSGLRVVMAKEGQLIFKKPGKRIEFLNPPSLSPDLRWQIQFADSAIEDIGGQHDASSGNTPDRVSSGAAIEALQRGDSNSISEMRDNFEDSLSLDAAWTLKMYSLFEKDGIVMNHEMKDKNDQFAIVGKGAYEAQKRDLPQKYYMEDNGGYCDVCAILPDNQVKVSVQSQLGETREARLDLLFRLVEAGLPLKVVLEHLEFPGSDDILERVAEEALGDIMLENMKGQMSAPPGGQVMPPMPPEAGGSTQPGIDDAALEDLIAQTGGMLSEQ